jgi:pyruvate kinase
VRRAGWEAAPALDGAHHRRARRAGRSPVRPSVLALALVVLGLAACGSSSSSSRPAADVAVCTQINADIQRLYAQSQSNALQQSPAGLARTDRATSAKLRALEAAPGISAQLKTALTNTGNTINMIATLQPTAARNPAGVLQAQQQFATNIQQLRNACK